LIERAKVVLIRPLAYF